MCPTFDVVTVAIITKGESFVLAKPVFFNKTWVENLNFFKQSHLGHLDQTTIEVGLRNPSHNDWRPAVVKRVTINFDVVRAPIEVH